MSDALLVRDRASSVAIDWGDAIGIMRRMAVTAGIGTTAERLDNGEIPPQILPSAA